MIVRPNTGLRKTNWLILLVLVGAAALQVLAVRYVAPSTKGETISYDRFSGLKSRIAGWDFESLDLGDTEFVSNESQRILNLTDFTRCQYRNNGQMVEVYLAHWEPGASSFRNVVKHRPEKCWPKAGWLLEESEDGFIFENEHIAIVPAQYRKFKIENSTLWVAYWYVLDGEVIEIQPNDPRPLWETRLPLKLEWLAQRRGQYFLRVSSNRPLEEIWRQQIGHELLKIVSPLIAADRKE